MTSLSIILLFTNYLLLSSCTPEGDVRGYTLKREGNVSGLKCIAKGSEDVLLGMFLLVNPLFDLPYPEFNQTSQTSLSVLRSRIEK